MERDNRRSQPHSPAALAHAVATLTGGEGVPAHHKHGVQYPQVCDESLFSSLVAWEGLRLEIKKIKKSVKILIMCIMQPDFTVG